MENTNFNDITSVLGGNKDFKVSLDKDSIVLLSLSLAIAIFIAVFAANKIAKL